ncbi:MAG: protein MauE [Desulfobacteraceae bacterium]|nr:protein MauE [Desulfobacteraceae bacterium]
MKLKTMKIDKLKITEILISIVLGLTFIVASYHKIIDPARFAKVIYGYAIFPDFAINVLAIIIPFIELVAGISLILRIHTKSALSIINMFLISFILVIAFNLLRGHEFECGCFSFGNDSQISSAVSLLIRDILLLIAGVSLWVRQSKFLKNYI